MVAVDRWTGAHAQALRFALRMSVRAYAGYLGVAVRTVSKWERFGASTYPRGVSQEVLDVALARCDDDTRARFAVALAARTGGPLVPVPSGDLDHEGWVDDIERAATALGGQNFAFAAALLQRWTAGPDPHRLDERGLYLYARSTTLLGDLRRDQGLVSGPLSAAHTYTIARSVYAQLGLARRVAQLDLALTVTTEMSGLLDTATRRYEHLADDERLTARDRARALLWVGTSLSKNGDHAHAMQIIGAAGHEFDRLGEADDWSVTQQKLALAARGAGDLTAALRHLSIARDTANLAAPLQRVRLDTAHSHILLTDPATADEGHRLLARAEKVAAAYGMSHQLRSIARLQQATDPGDPQ